MPRNYQMSWEGAPYYRWVKMYKGTRYRVSCAELNMPAPWRSDTTYQAANEWWQDKIATIGQKILKIKFESLEAAEARAIEQTSRIEELKRAVAAAEAGEEYEIEEVDSFKPPCPIKQSIRSHLDDFLSELKVGDIKPQSYKEIENYLEKLLDAKILNAHILPPSMAIKEVNEDTITKHYKWLSQQSWEAAGKNKRLGFFRRFLTWAIENDKLQAPKNLKRKAHRWKVITKPVKVWQKPWRVLQKLPNNGLYNFKLWGLLGLNCGMTQADMGELTWDMIDLKAKTLIRKRVKTQDVKGVPTVTYFLWDETIKELEKSKHREGLVFTMSDGATPMYCTFFNEDGEPSKKDMFSTNWNRLKEKPKIPLGKWRSVAATQLKKSELYEPYIDYFLGHAANKLSDKHYASPADNPFFRACEFIRQQLKIAK